MLKVLLIVLSVFAASAQSPRDTLQSAGGKHFRYLPLAIPAVFISYGVLGLKSDQLLDFNSEVREEVTEDIDRKISVDDFSQYAPVASVFALDLADMKAKHSVKQRAIIGLTSFAMVAVSVEALKAITKEPRPDGTSRNSFPSGHTATAFAGAEMLWQEYRNHSIWIGISGYAVAAGTGIFRIYNNRHWLTDVVAGAGIGMLCTKLSYLFYPSFNELLYAKSYTVSFMPSYENKDMAVTVSVHF